jgi:hypothetical protein
MENRGVELVMNALTEHNEDFSDWDDYHRFLTAVTVSDEFDLLNVKIREGIINPCRAVRFFTHISSGDLWWLVEPDPPSRGAWERLTEESFASLTQPGEMPP